jgi:murein DD-endopeptidase MepM/ murein hydrolase activator NlpD
VRPLLDGRLRLPPHARAPERSPLSAASRRSVWALAALVLVAAASSCARQSGPFVASSFGSFFNDEFGRDRRPFPNPGVDYQDVLGAPVLAPADGVVVEVLDEAICRVGLVIEHAPWERWTRYCELRDRFVATGQAVKRGQPIGTFGGGGIRSGITGLEYPVHVELWTRRPAGLPEEAFHKGLLLDPQKFMVGCFSLDRSYPTDRFAPTYPARC